MALRRRRTSSCCQSKSAPCSAHSLFAASYLQLIDQHRDGVELVLISLSLHLDGRGMYGIGKGHVLACTEDGRGGVRDEELSRHRLSEMTVSGSLNG